MFFFCSIFLTKKIVGNRSYFFFRSVFVDDPRIDSSFFFFAVFFLLDAQAVGLFSGYNGAHMFAEIIFLGEGIELLKVRGAPAKKW